jgi:ABC-type uncharacterized transport system substrate-binding protein
MTFGQQLFLMKTLKPSLKRLGIMSFTLTNEDAQRFVRAGRSLGVTVTVGKVRGLTELSSLYRKLIVEFNTEMICIPEGDDKMMLGVGLDFLRESTLEDKIGLCVPTREAFAKGALCSFENDNNKFTVYVNRRIAEVVGATIPSGQSSTIIYIVQ